MSTAALLGLLCLGAVAALELDQAPAQPGEWGYRPADGETVAVDPPAFSWRPTRGATDYELQIGRDERFEPVVYAADGITWSVHCPPATLAPGDYLWRYRAVDGDGPSDWSAVRTFTVAADATPMPMPSRDELLGRIPAEHPRLFVRPEQLDDLRARRLTDLAPQYEALRAQCERLLAEPPDTTEPIKYPADVESRSERWREIWWGNRTYTIAALNGAASLAFCWRLDGNEAYGQLARRILMDCAEWDPKGATGYRYNDEAGMPYNYLFSRTYTFVYPLLSEAEREECRRVMKIRGDEMYAHLCPNHLWRPYSSHSNRAWHKLGEIGIAFLGEVEGAEDWVWFAMNVFYCAYPVWSDDDGGWHEGVSYWTSYIQRFGYFADVMRSAFGLDAFDKPFFASAGYYPLYLIPPGKTDGGFGDLCEGKGPANVLGLMTVLAQQAGNPHWQWYVEQAGGPRPEGGYIGYVRGATPAPEPAAPSDLPGSRLFRGTGQAYLNSSLLDAREGVHVNFKSSPFGTQSHGYEAINSFLIYAYGEPLLIRTGRRDIYGSEHHNRWMWSTRSVNNITVDGIGQRAHSAGTAGEIVAFATTPGVDVVVGEAGPCYDQIRDGQRTRVLTRFQRSIVFVKPDLVVVYDRLAATQPRRFEYWLHAVNEMRVAGQRVSIESGEARCEVDFLTPNGLSFAQTNQYDPNPRERITVREWHLTATTEPSERLEFVTCYWPRRAADERPRSAELATSDGWHQLTARIGDESVQIMLPQDDAAVLPDDQATLRNAIVVTRQGAEPVTVPLD